MIRSRSLAAALLCGLLIAAAGFGMMRSEAHAAAAPFYAYYAYTDPRTGEAFFNIHRDAEYFVVFRTADGEWIRLPETVHSIGSGSGEGCVIVSARILQQVPVYDICYDAAADELIHTAVFQPSPSGKWSLKHVSLLGYMDAERPTGPAGGSILYGTRGIPAQSALLVKDSARGVVRQIYGSSGFRRSDWLPDGTLLVEQFSETERQNELVRVNPATGETNRILLGSLRGYNKELGLLLCVKNEPSRTLRIYDLLTGQFRLAEEGEADALFYDLIKQERLKEPSVPKDLDLDALPVADTGIRQEHGAALALDGSEIPLPFAFIGSDGETYVPLRPLAELGWTMRREVFPGGGHEYVVETDRGSLVVNPGNSVAMNGHIFIKLALIRSLGHDAELKWQR